MSQQSQLLLALPEYAVPEQFSRGWVQPVADVRGRSYFYGVGALSSGVIAIALTILTFGTYLFSLIPAVMAIYLGILAMVNAKKSQPTAFSKKATAAGIWGIVCGALALPMTIWLFTISLDIFDSAEYSDLSSYASLFLF